MGLKTASYVYEEASSWNKFGHSYNFTIIEIKANWKSQGPMVKVLTT